MLSIQQLLKVKKKEEVKEKLERTSRHFKGIWTKNIRNLGKKAVAQAGDIIQTAQNA